MGKFTFANVTGNPEQAELQGSYYEGPTPPPGLYRLQLKSLKLQAENSKGNPMLRLLWEVNEPAGSPKAKYNGYGIFDQLNVTDSQAPYVNKFLDACGFDRKRFWGGVTVDSEQPNPNVLKIGTKSPIGVMCAATTKIDQYNGESKLEIGRYTTVERAAEFDGDADADQDEDDDTSAPDADEDEPDEDSDEDGDEEDAAEDEEAATDTSDEPYTETELKDYSRDELKKILTEDFKAELPSGRLTDAKLIAAILEAQDAAAGDSEEPEDGEEDEDEPDEDAEEEEDEDGYTEAELSKLDVPALKKIVKEEFEGKTFKTDDVPKLVKRILELQEAKAKEPPF